MHDTEAFPSRPTLTKTGLGILVVAAISLTAAGCQTIDPYTREEKVSKTTTGAAIGAVGGAVAGALIGGNRKGALIGAGVGALAGGAIGNYMDREEAKLRAQLEGTGVSVTRVGDQVILNMPGNVTFATNSADISPNFHSVLNSVALVINEFKQTYVDIVGHTDSSGAADFNQRLSEQRAVSVGGYLQSQGVLPQRIVTRGMGETQPIASNSTPQGRSQNRRVEIVLTPVT